MRSDERFVDLHLPALAADVLQLFGGLARGARRVVCRLKTKARTKSRNAEQSQGIVLQNADGVFESTAGDFEDVRFDGTLSPKGVVQCPAPSCGHGVDAEIASRKVMAQRSSEGHMGLSVAVFVLLLDPKGRDLDGGAVHQG